MTLSPLQEWTKANVLDVAAGIFAAAPATRDETCDECLGTGVDGFFRDDGKECDCEACDGFGWRTVELGPDARRRWIDRRLRQAGLNPKAFDDEGRLIGR